MSIEHAEKLLREANTFLEYIDNLFWSQATLNEKLAKIRMNAARRVYRRWILAFGGRIK